MTSMKIGFFFALFAVAGVHSQWLSYFVPPSPCPNMFRYVLNNTIGFYDGEAGVVLSPYDRQRGVYEFEINMTVVANVAQQDGLKITISSPQRQILEGNVIMYRIIFPISAGRVLPYLTELKFNGRLLCQGPSPPLESGRQHSAMWAKSTLTTSSVTNWMQPTTASWPFGQSSHWPITGQQFIFGGSGGIYRSGDDAQAADEASNVAADDGAKSADDGAKSAAEDSQPEAVAAAADSAAEPATDDSSR